MMTQSNPKAYYHYCSRFPKKISKETLKLLFVLDEFNNYKPTVQLKTSMNYVFPKLP